MLAELCKSLHFVIPIVCQLSCPLLPNALELHQRGSFLCKLVECQREQKLLEDAFRLRLSLLIDHDEVGG